MAQQSNPNETVFLRGPAATHSSSLRLDSMFHDETSGRLAVVASLLAFIALAALTVSHFIPALAAYDKTGTSGTSATNNISLVAQLVVSSAVAILAWRRKIPVRWLTLAVIAFQVFACWEASIGATRMGLLGTGHVPVFTFTEVLIVFFPLMMPIRPSVTILAATLSGSMRTLAAVAVSHHEGIALEPSWFLPTIIAPAFAILLALVASKIIYGLGAAVARARRVGSYHLEEVLGKGGMGEVWRARHQMLKRRAAIKFIRPKSEGGQLPATALERFEREAQATAALSSPHTIKLFDYGRADDGSFYYVMELLEGITLDQLVKRFGPVPPERCIHFVRGICHSLAEAHAAGMIHRDIKPANLFACKYGLDRDMLKVLDFGLVAESRRSPDETMLTGADQAIGTPAFIAPESARGESIDQRTDIYAIGCVIYWLLAGRLVFEAETPMAMAVAHATDPPPPLVDVCEYELPDALIEITERCLAKSPSERPRSVIELGDTLDAIALERPWTPERAASWWTRHHPLETTSRS